MESTGFIEIKILAVKIFGIPCNKENDQVLFQVSVKHVCAI